MLKFAEGLKARGVLNRIHRVRGQRVPAHHPFDLTFRRKREGRQRTRSQPQIPIRDDADQLGAVEHRQVPDAFLGNDPICVLQGGVRRNSHDRTFHDVTDQHDLPLCDCQLTIADRRHSVSKH